MFRNNRLFILLVLSFFMLCSCASEPTASTATTAPASTPEVEQSTPEPVVSTAVPSEEATEEAPTVSPEAPAETDTALTGAFAIEDLALVIDGDTYKVKDNAAALLAKLGDDYDFSEAISCVFDGNDKIFTYSHIEISTYPDGDNDIIDQFLLLDDTYETMRGIKVGSSKADVEAAYGDGYFLDGPYMTYTISGDESDIESPRCYFELDESDVVLSISLHYPTVEN